MHKQEISSISISVIIAVRNGAKTIGESLESVAVQSYPALEVIVVDDGSTDGCAESSKAELRRLNLVGEVIRLEDSVGAGSARNLAAEQSRGELLAILDADDCWAIDHLSDAVSAFTSHQELVGYCSRVEIRTNANWMSTGRVFPAEPGYLPEGAQNAYFAILKGLNVWNVTLCMRREAFLEAGGFEESLICYEDLWLILNVTRQGDFYLSNKIGCIVRKNTDSLSASELKSGAHSMSKSMFADRIVFTKLMHEDPRFSADDVRVVKDACNAFIGTTFRDACRARDWNQSYRIVEAVMSVYRLQPFFVSRILIQSLFKTAFTGIWLLAQKMTRGLRIN